MARRSAAIPGALILVLSLVAGGFLIFAMPRPEYVEPKYFIAATAAAAAALVLVISQRDIERGLFFLFVIAMPVRAVAQLWPMPLDVEVLTNTWVPLGRAWTGATLGAPTLAISDIPLAALWLYACIKHRPRVSRFPLWIFWGAGLFILVGFFSVTNAKQQSLSIWAIADTLKGALGGAYIVYRTRVKADLDFTVHAIQTSVLIQSVVAILQFLTRSTLGLTFSGTKTLDLVLGGDAVRASGTMAHSQMLAMLLCCFLPLTYSGVLAGSLKTWILRNGVFLAALISLILTFSRMGWFAAACSILFVTLRLRRLAPVRSRSALRFAIVLIFVVLVFVSLLDLMLPNITVDRPGSDLSVARDLYKVAFNMTLAHPILGVGINNFSYVMGAYDLTGISFFFPAPVHNLFVLVLAEMGILGLFALLSMLGIPVLILYRGARSTDIQIHRYAVSLLGGVMALGLLSLTSWTYFTMQMQVWLFLGVAMSLARLTPIRQMHSKAMPAYQRG